MKEIKLEMMKLWNEVFGDSDEYISLLFSHYFHPDHTEFFEEDGRIISALLKIPYCFKTKEERKLRGLYLCGLATSPEYRGRGLMSQLLQLANEKAKADGYDFTFLIPADDSIRTYYKRKGFYNSFYNEKEFFVAGHKFSKKEGGEVRLYREEDKDKLVNFLINSQENENKANENIIEIIHNKNDWMIVLDEALISCEPVFLHEIGDNIDGVAFCRLSHKEVIVKKIITTSSNSKEVENSIFEGITRAYPEKGIVAIRSAGSSVPIQSDQIWSPFYAKNNENVSEYEEMSNIEEIYDESLTAFPFGMINIFDVKNLLNNLGIDVTNLFEGFEEEEIKNLILRKPGLGSQELLNLLKLPVLNFYSYLLLE